MMSIALVDGNAPAFRPPFAFSLTHQIGPVTFNLPPVPAVAAIPLPTAPALNALEVSLGIAAGPWLAGQSILFGPLNITLYNFAPPFLYVPDGSPITITPSSSSFAWSVNFRPWRGLYITGQGTDQGGASYDGFIRTPPGLPKA